MNKEPRYIYHVQIKKECNDEIIYQSGYYTDLKKAVNICDKYPNSSLTIQHMNALPSPSNSEYIKQEEFKCNCNTILSVWLLGNKKEKAENKKFEYNLFHTVSLESIKYGLRRFHKLALTDEKLLQINVTTEKCKRMFFKSILEKTDADENITCRIYRFPTNKLIDCKEIFETSTYIYMQIPMKELINLQIKDR